MESKKHGYKVVVVNDEIVAVKAICRIIEKYCPKFEVVGIAGNESKALDMIQKTSPDLVLIDVEIPVMDGLNFIHQAREKIPNLCFGIISGYQDFGNARDTLQGCILECLTKPIVPSKMQIAMNNIEEKLRKIL